MKRDTLRPDFIIIGAMKCGTSTLQAQLVAQPGIFMTTPKEPNYFSDDDMFGLGPDHYRGLFADAAPGDLRGEASTHYTKLPTYPETVPRMTAALGSVKCVYMIRNPIERARSHYIHEWTMGKFDTDPDTALARYPEMIAYGCYGMQVRPFVDAFGMDNVFLSSLEQMKADPGGVLASVCRFIGYEGDARWQDDLQAQNVSKERYRRLPMEHLLIHHPVSQWLRRTLVPKSVRNRIRESRTMNERPEFSAASHARMVEAFREDRERLEKLFPGSEAITAAYARIG